MAAATQRRGDALLEPPPRDERRIIRDAQMSGMFPRGMPSKRAAFMRQFGLMQQNAEVRAMQERRRGLQEAQRTQMDYERVLGDAAQSRIAPLRTFNHQMNDRQRLANSLTGQIFLTE
jgi:hypothetical protein